MTKKQNYRLSRKQQNEVWALFDQVLPATEIEWSHVGAPMPHWKPNVNDFLTQHRGLKWNATLFAELATTILGYEVKASNVYYILVNEGYEGLRRKREPKPPEPPKADLEVLRELVHYLDDCNRVVTTDLLAVMAYLTRKDPEWKSKQ